ncbi:helix-turn-helix transcriptional regulator [Sinanaerobacter sp. ZZT-01]|uniref:helix-turn-helix domain-containing protein n=1 Tax=Sinanaerobacter sp. ZZT-01 TaxID=3111540 RepID=UPI002D799FC7|nr:helix-turn-helix transcriptional regulator [Sinanaerobacter sp. ZZT-01]WRR93763.1 helix-turn-helix transcriptional regulator [Sinanaerobacter sp. ZZT-01]
MQSIDNQEFGQFLAQLRKEKGMTQKQLAEQLFLSDKAISKWERGLSLPDISLLMPLSKIFNVTTTELLCGKRIAINAQFSIDEVDAIMSKTITLSKDEIEKKEHSKQIRIRIFIGSICIFIAELILFLVSGHSISTIRESVYTVELLMAISGTYFTFFAKEELPIYYDSNHISQYTHGVFRMNIPGVHLNNSNWNHIVKTVHLTTMIIFTIFPLLYFSLSSFFPRLWESGELFFTLGAVLAMFIPICIVGKKYE